MTEPAPPDVSVVLPCYNERDHVEQEIKRIRASLESAGMTYELICVDDGSTDGTREVLKQIPDVVRELNDDYDQVVGARKSEAGTYKFFRVPAKWAIRRLASYLTSANI